MTIFWTFFSLSGTTSAQALKTVPVLKNLQSRVASIAVQAKAEGGEKCMYEKKSLYQVLIILNMH